MREAFSFHSLFIGGDPFRVPAIYAALVYLQVLDGVWYADGGVYASSRRWRGRSTCAAARGCERIERTGGRVTGVVLDGGERVAADVVVSNADVLRRPRCWRPPGGLRGRQKPTMSCFLLYLGHGPALRPLRHHTLLVGRGYRRFIADVTRAAGCRATFSTYLHAPSRTEPGMAPPGGDSIAVLLPVPNLAAGWTGRARPTGCATRSWATWSATFGLEGLARQRRRRAPHDAAGLPRRARGRRRQRLLGGADPAPERLLPAAQPRPARPRRCTTSAAGRTRAPGMPGRAPRAPRSRPASSPRTTGPPGRSEGGACCCSGLSRTDALLAEARSTTRRVGRTFALACRLLPARRARRRLPPLPRLPHARRPRRRRRRRRRRRASPPSRRGATDGRSARREAAVLADLATRHGLPRQRCATSAAGCATTSTGGRSAPRPTSTATATASPARSGSSWPRCSARRAPGAERAGRGARHGDAAHEHPARPRRGPRRRPLLRRAGDARALRRRPAPRAAARRSCATRSRAPTRSTTRAWPASAPCAAAASRSPRPARMYREILRQIEREGYGARAGPRRRLGAAASSSWPRARTRPATAGRAPAVGGPPMRRGVAAGAAASARRPAMSPSRALLAAVVAVQLAFPQASAGARARCATAPRAASSRSCSPRRWPRPRRRAARAAAAALARRRRGARLRGRGRRRRDRPAVRPLPLPATARAARRRRAAAGRRGLVADGAAGVGGARPADAAARAARGRSPPAPSPPGTSSSTRAWRATATGPGTGPGATRASRPRTTPAGWRRAPRCSRSGRALDGDEDARDGPATARWRSTPGRGSARRPRTCSSGSARASRSPAALAMGAFAVPALRRAPARRR